MRKPVCRVYAAETNYTNPAVSNLCLWLLPLNVDKEVPENENTGHFSDLLELFRLSKTTC